MAKKTRVREHERTAPKRNNRGPSEDSPDSARDAVRDWMRKENNKTQEGFREWETPPPERKRR
jgi:hypothetical protein